MGVGLIVMATGRYRDFLPQLVDSAQEHLMGLERVFVASDEDPHVDGAGVATEWLPWPRLAWPLPTLLRYHMMSLHRSRLIRCEQLLYVDVDMTLVDRVEIPAGSGLVAVVHPGHKEGVRRRFPYESRRRSAAYVASDEGTRYFCGGVQGGASPRYLHAAATMADRIDVDMRRGIIPRWHDESVWNRYLCDYPPETVWGPEYCSPDSEPTDLARILALSKDHALVRSGKSRSRSGTALRMARTAAEAYASQALFVMRRPLGR